MTITSALYKDCSDCRMEWGDAKRQGDAKSGWGWPGQGQWQQVGESRGVDSAPGRGDWQDGHRRFEDDLQVLARTFR